MSGPTPAITRALSVDPFAQTIVFQGRAMSRADARALEREVLRFRVALRRAAKRLSTHLTHAHRHATSLHALSAAVNDNAWRPAAYCPTDDFK